MKNTITGLLLFISILSFGQQKDSTKLKELELLEKLSYGFTSEIFKKPENKSKLDKDYKLPWTQKFYTEEQFKIALDTLIKNATVKIKEGSFSNHVLEFNSYFPEFIDEGLMEIFDLSIKTNKIKNGNTILEIDKYGSTGYGSYSSSGFDDGNLYAHNWRTISTSFNIKSEMKTGEYEGTISFESGFVKDYDYVKINKSDVGKEIKIGDYTFTVIDVLNNSIVLDFKNSIEELKFYFVNLNKEGHRITSTGKVFSSQTLFKDIYLMFKENPNLSFEDFKKIVHPKYLEMIENVEKMTETQENIFGKKYHVFSSSDKLINSYLYLPKYNSEVFEIEYSKNQEQRTPIAKKTSPAEKQIKLHFENENEDGVLLGEEIELLDKDLKGVKSIPAGVFVKIIGESLKYYDENKEDDSCNGYKYVKINYEEADYIVDGRNVFKLKKLDIQPTESGSRLEFLEALSKDYLQPLMPSSGFEFCDHLTFSPIIVRNIKTDKYSFIDVLKDELYSKITGEFKDANFFQSGSNYKIYDEITKIEISDNGFILMISHDDSTFKVLLTEKNNNYIAKYIE